MTDGNHLFRSCLYMPADNEKLLLKSSELKTDAVIFDFEDAVAPDNKALARQMLAKHLTTFDQSQKPALVRVNAIDTPWFEEDVNAVAAMSCFGIVLPKVVSPQDMFDLDKMLSNLGVSKSFEIWAMVETAPSIAHSAPIASTANNSRLTTFLFGTNDLAKETGAPLLKGRDNMMPWLAQATICAKAQNMRVIDSVMQDFGDIEGLEYECSQAMGLGMDGKSVIHPKQLEITNKVFTPKAEEIEWAIKIVETFQLEENRNKAVIKIDNKMVEHLHFEMAKVQLSRYETIHSKGF